MLHLSMPPTPRYVYPIRVICKQGQNCIRVMFVPRIPIISDNLANGRSSVAVLAMAGFVAVIASITKPTMIFFMEASRLILNADRRQQQGDEIDLGGDGRSSG